MVFEDREDAGEQLGEELVERDIEADIVLAIPRGGLPLGRKVADTFDVPLDVVVSSKLGAPGNPELGIGAAASDGSYWINRNIAERTGADEEFIEEEKQKMVEKAKNKLEFYRGRTEQPDVEGKSVVLADDGMATGGTMLACVRQLKELDSKNVTVAVPVASKSSINLIEEETDEIIALEVPEYFGAVGSFYRDFSQVMDEEAKRYLE